ncbi:hexosyltransferase [Acetobacter pasteurianus NBRC 101655]|uniref:glycosyltransferase family 4 protein n=1 Tax=Acetobacter pasteurianus TaxID=438 RepID=UPI0002D4C609|nr:glycosyltransferase family 4 protein [Acetobacter pasteurianus]BAU39664.1 hexosyltransferase [Acetobacter pasteurianus NBRC 101655]CCT59488.1 glycosyl transferase group 1 [Acetobacter pasteurianus 386B]
MCALRVLTVLPPRERFAPQQAGAIALLVHRTVLEGETVIGSPLSVPSFQGVAFQPVPSVLYPLGRIGRYIAGVARIIRQLQPELVEVHNRPDIALGLRKCFPHLPVSLVLHNDPCGMKKARTAAERETLVCKVAVVAVSEWVRKRFSSSAAENVYVLPNCLDFSALPEVPITRENLLLFAGRVVADKGVDSFVAACADVLPSHPTWRAEIIGADRFGPDSPQTPFLKQLRVQAQAAHVAMAGYQPHHKVLEAMGQAAIVVIPSRWPEPFGMVALEAMGMGAAVVASPRGGLPEVVGTAGVYANPDDVPALANILRDLMNDPQKRSQMSVAGYQQAHKFDAEIIRKKRQLLHEELVKAWPQKRK